MLVKVMKGRGTENAHAPIVYLLDDDGNRLGATILSGDPNITAALIDNSPFTQKYTSICLSFEESADDPKFTESFKQQLIREFEEMMFPGLEPSQFNTLWVEHTDKPTPEQKKQIERGEIKAVEAGTGRLELNVLIPNVELSTGKRLQPFYYKQDLPRFNAWQNVVNKKYKLSNPHDTQKRNKILADDYPNKPSTAKYTEITGKAEAEAYLNKHKQNNFADINTRKAVKELVANVCGSLEYQQRWEVVSELKKIGFEAKENKNGITVKAPNMQRAVRLKAEVLSDTEHLKKLKNADKYDLQAMIEKKAEYLKELYKPADFITDLPEPATATAAAEKSDQPTPTPYDNSPSPF